MKNKSRLLTSGESRRLTDEFSCLPPSKWSIFLWRHGEMETWGDNENFQVVIRLAVESDYRSE